MSFSNSFNKHQCQWSIAIWVILGLSITLAWRYNYTRFPESWKCFVFTTLFNNVTMYITPQLICLFNALSKLGSLRFVTERALTLTIHPLRLVYLGFPQLMDDVPFPSILLSQPFMAQLTGCEYSGAIKTSSKCRVSMRCCSQ